MPRLPISILLLLHLLVYVSCQFPAADEAVRETTLDGKVIGIADGDTFTLLMQENQKVRIRLYGIDCPEKAQDFGQVAKQKLSDLIFNRQVKIVKKYDDRYGRAVALVYDEKNNCINEEMLRAGLAWHFTRYDSNTAWQQLQDEAQAKRIGLWSDPHPTPPWQWRKR